MFNIDSFVHRNFQDPESYGNPQTDWAVNCPFCLDVIGKHDSGHHLHISIIKQTVHCFRCGYAASWIVFVRDMTGFPYWRIIGELYYKPRLVDWHNISKSVDVSDDKVHDSSLPSGFISLLEARGNMSNFARQYLYKRGFGKSYWKRYNLGVSDDLPGRVIIPIERGYWQARAIMNFISPKYINPKNPAKDVIFNGVALNMYDEIVICEGAFSAMAIGDNAIALIGKEAPAEKLARLIDSNVTSFVLAVEPDAFPTMRKLADNLQRNGKNVTVWKYLNGDPADPDGRYVEMSYTFDAKVRMLLN